MDQIHLGWGILLLGSLAAAEGLTHAAVALVTRTTHGIAELDAGVKSPHKASAAQNKADKPGR